VRRRVPPKSLAGREEVSLSTRAIIAHSVPQPYLRKAVGAPLAAISPPGCQHPGVASHSLLRGLCTCSAVYAVVKVPMKEKNILLIGTDKNSSKRVQ